MANLTVSQLHSNDIKMNTTQVAAADNTNKLQKSRFNTTQAVHRQTYKTVNR